MATFYSQLHPIVHFPHVLPPQGLPNRPPAHSTPSHLPPSPVSGRILHFIALPPSASHRRINKNCSIGTEGEGKGKRGGRLPLMSSLRPSFLNLLDSSWALGGTWPVWQQHTIGCQEERRGREAHNRLSGGDLWKWGK
jgi:hypothetical protein